MSKMVIMEKYYGVNFLRSLIATNQSFPTGQNANLIFIRGLLQNGISL